MGLFSLACTALSLYVWSITLYNVYHPLRQNVIQAVPSLSPGNVASVLYRLVTESSAQSTPQTTRRGRKPKRLTLAEAQREELRDALKALLIWLVCKGIEPALDNSLGYLLPFYSLFKAMMLLVYARFRLALSVQLFESFVVPLGKPNTPLVNLNAFTTLIFPALRFLLSLPFAHIKMLIRNFAMPLVASWTSADSRPVSATTSPIQEARSIQDDRVPPPQMMQRGFEHRKPSASRGTTRRDDKKGGPGGPGGGEGAKTGRGKALKGQKSMDTLASSSRIPSFDRSTSQRSVSSQIAPNLQHVLTQLQSLPSVPQERPLVASAAQQLTVAGGSPGVLPTFAHIPVPTSSTPFKRLPDDLVPPPTLTPVAGSAEKTPNSRFSMAFSPPPSMPGFLQGLAAQGSDPLHQSDSQDSTIQPFIIQDQADVSYVLEAPNESNNLATPSAQQQGEGAPVDVDAVTSTTEKDADSQEAPESAKTSEKRKGEDDGESEKEIKTRSPPSRRNRTKAATDTSKDAASAKDARTPTAKKGENAKSTKPPPQKAAATEEVNGSSQAPSLPRSRSTRKAGSVASSSETSKATTRSSRRQAATRSK